MNRRCLGQWDGCLTPRWLVVLLLGWLLAGVSQAADIYVKPNGSGSACTLGNECTFGTGRDQLGPGETLFMRGGSYSMGNFSLPCGSSENARVFIRNYQNEVATIHDAAGDGRGAITIGNGRCGYITMEGSYNKSTDQRGIVINGLRLDLGVDINPGSTELSQISHHLTFRNIELTDTNSHMITNGGSHIILDNAYIHHNRGSHCIYVHWSDSILENSKFEGCQGFGIHWRNSKGDSGKCQPTCGVERNILRNTIVSGAGVGRAGGAGITMAYGSNNQIYNNLAYDNAEYGIGVTSANSKVWNNTVVNNNLSNLASQGGLRDNNAGNEVINNIVWGNRRQQIFTTNTTSQSRSNLHHNHTGSDPLFVNYNGKDFHLKAGSPVINAGANLSCCVTKDFDGATRPVNGAWDIGAYEFGGTAPACTKPGGDCTPPSVPTGLVATRDSNTQASLNWSDSTGSPTDYHVRECLVGSGQSSCTPGQVVANPTASAQVRTGLTAGATYFWSVSALDANDNESESSASVSLTMSAPVADSQAPNVPTGLACTAPTFSQVSCSWTASTDNPTTGGAGTAGYRIQSCQGAGCTPVDPFDTSATTSYTKANLTAQQTYGFQVAAFDAASPVNVSAYSSTQYAVTPAQPTGSEAILLLNSDFTDASGQGHTATATGVGFDLANKIEGTAAALFDAATDRLSIPLLSGFEPPLVDNCNRTENPLASGWAGPWNSTAPGAMLANGTTCMAVTSTHSSAYWGTLQPADQVITATIPDATSAQYVRLAVRLQQPSGSTATVDGYRCHWNANQGRIQRLDNATNVELTPFVSAPLTDGDRFGCQIVGSTISLWINHLNAGWQQITSVTDTTYTGQGYAGIQVGATDLSLDDIRLGAVGGSAAAFSNPNTLTLALSVRPTSFPTGTAPDVRRYLVSHSTSPLYANLIQLCINASGQLQLGLGGSSHCAANPNIMQLALNTWYRVVLRLDNGAYTVHVDGVQKAAGSYTSLSTFDTSITLGNHLGADQGWRGQMDAVKLVEQVWSTAQIDADCDLYVAGGCAGTGPTFDPLVMVSGIMGDGTNSANNTRVTVTLQGPTGADPAACATLDNFDLRYATVRQPVATCAITGTSMQLTVATPPVSPATALTLAYLPEGQQISLTNSTVAGATDGASLEQRQWMCRRPGTSPTIHWQAPVNTVCGVPSPGLVDVQVDLVWVGTGSSPAQNYALWCDATPDDAIDQGVRLGTEFDQYGTLPIRYASQHASSFLITDGTPITPEMPAIGGIAAVGGGTMRRQEASNTLPNLAQNQRTEYRFALEFDEAIPSNTTFACELRPAQASGRLSSIIPARIEVRLPMFTN
jgi:Concanavalin A-like lectin/glucanases superfamily/Right handed beta helix region